MLEQQHAGAAPAPIMLAHLRIGVALFELEPAWTTDLVDRFRRQLDIGGFTAAFPGYLPLIHRRLRPGDIPHLDVILDEGFAFQDPIGLAADRDWCQALQLVLQQPLAPPALPPPVVAPAALPRRHSGALRKAALPGLVVAGAAGLFLLPLPWPVPPVPVLTDAPPAGAIHILAGAPVPGDPISMAMVADPAPPGSALEPGPPQPSPMAQAPLTDAAPMPAAEPEPPRPLPTPQAAPAVAEPPSAMPAPEPEPPQPLSTAQPEPPETPPTAQAAMPDAPDTPATEPASPDPLRPAEAPAPAPPPPVAGAPRDSGPDPLLTAAAAIITVAAPPDIATLWPAPAIPTPPVTAPVTAPPAITAPRPDSAMATTLLRRGTALLALGDISGARRFLERAAAGGSAPAASLLAETYDPHTPAGLPTRGLQPDPGAALAWYRRAAALGAAVGPSIAALESAP